MTKTKIMEMWGEIEKQVTDLKEMINTELEDTEFDEDNLDPETQQEKADEARELQEGV